MKRNHVIAIVILAAVATVSFTWFKGMVISYQDLVFLPLGQKNFSHFFYSWDSFASPLGVQTSRLIQGAFTYYGFIYVFQSIGFSQVLIESLLFYLLFFGSGISMYYFYQKITQKQEASFGALAAGLIYMMNSYSLLFIWNYFSTFGYLYAFTPLILGLFLDRLNKGKTGFTQALVVAFIWTVSSLAAFGNPTFAIYTWLAILFLVLVYYFSHLKSKIFRKSFSFTLKIGFAWLLFNAFWILPLAFADRQVEINLANTSVVSKFDLMTVVTQNSVSILDSVRLTGFSMLHDQVNGVPYYSWAAAWDSIPFILVSLLYPLLLFGGIIVNRRSKLPFLFSILLLGFGIAACTGPYTPLGALFSAVLYNTGLINLYYITFPRFGIYLTLAVSLAAGLFLDRLFVWRKFTFHNFPLPKLLSIFLVILIVPVLNFPFFDGSVIRSGGGLLPSARIEIPQDYYDLERWISSYSEDGFVLSLPMSTDSYYFLNWNHGFYGSNPDSWIIDRPVLYAQTDNISSLLISNLKLGIMPNFAKVLAAINVRFVLVHNDTDWDLIGLSKTMVPWSTERLDTVLSGEPNFRLAAIFGNLTVFENTLWQEDNIPIINSMIPPTSVNQTLTPMDEFQSWDDVSENKFYSSFSGDWQPIVRTDGSMSDITISFNGEETCSYTFPSYSDGFLNAFNTTLLYVKAGPNPLIVTEITIDAPGAYVDGAWWDSDWMGMSTKAGSFPFVIPANERAIIAVVGNKGAITVHTINPADVVFETASGEDSEGLKSGLIVTVSGDATVSNYSRVSPVDFEFCISSQSPFKLVLLQSYSTDWILRNDDGIACDFKHEAIGGYANSWAVSEAGDYSFTINHRSQDLLNVGAIITILAAVFTVIFNFKVISNAVLGLYSQVSKCLRKR